MILMLNRDESQKWFIMGEINKADEEIAKVNRQIKFQSMVSSDKPIPYNIVPLEDIKAIPIKVVMESMGYREHAPRLYLCPIHEDKHPSFRIHPNQNTFKCFACNAGGSNIDLLIHSQNIEIGEAIKQLINLM